MKQRSDARKNRKILLKAARQVFTEHGVSAPLDLVRERANVGRATLYRNFPNRQSLLLALADEALDQLELDATDFWSLMTAAAINVGANEVTHAIWGEPEMDKSELDIRRRKLVAIIDTHLDQAKRAGRILPQLEAADVILMLRMIGGATRAGPPHERKAIALKALEYLRTGVLGPGLGNVPIHSS